jgi:hypothetical protein
MKAKKYSEEQIIGALREADAGATVANAPIPAMRDEDAVRAVAAASLGAVCAELSRA